MNGSSAVAGSMSARCRESRGWGAVGGLVLSGLFAAAACLGGGDVLVVAPTFATACDVGASVSLASARRVSDRAVLVQPDDTNDAAVVDSGSDSLRSRKKAIT
jgi:outer membrane lipoprotein SlyB